MRPDHQELADGLKLASIAVVSAVLVATVVIGVGRVVLPDQQAIAAEHEDLVLAALR